jgi:serine/threonine-protein kinase
MNPERWQKIKGLFDAASEITPPEREKFLAQSCGADNELRRDVEKLLASSDEAESFMELPAAKEVVSMIIERKNLASGMSFGHYEIVKQIGAGGMGEVYLAKDTKLERRVAVKILSEKFAAHESNLQRFIQEAKAASALNHPNILVIHEIGESEKSNYIVSEYIEGETLRESFKQSLPKLSELLNTAIQIANALCAAHEAHIVHRDIKPENIMIRPDGFVKILDFGLAKLVEQKPVGFEASTVIQNQTANGVILGTVNYMSPEQAKGEKIDERTDIFSFGVVLYEMIAGRTPFAGDSMSETFANLINSEPPPLARFSSNTPDELQRIVAKMLRKKRDERYQTMKDLLSDLKDLRENLVFDERLEKSHPSNDKNATAFLQASTGDGNPQTDERNHNFTKQIKSRKSFVAFGLAVLLIAAFSFGYYFYNSKKSVSSANVKKSLAVLPFVNAGNDVNTEYLSDGVTESIINNLSQISSLRVMSRNSAFRFKNNQADVKNIAAQLGVETLVTGDIKQLGDKLVINVRLIDASDDSQIWGNQYVKDSGDILAAQNEIAQAVATNLRGKLSNSDQQQLTKRPTENAEAYQLYLRGRFHVFKLTPPEIQKGMSYFQQAIEVDPSYALAYVGLADAYRSFALSGEIPAADAMPKAKAAANKALEIDDRLAEVHSSLSSIVFWYDWDWNASENQIKRAIELNPNNADAHIFYAYILSNTGRHAEALAEARRAGELDPLSLVINALEGQFLLHAGQTDEALAKLRKTFELDLNFAVAHLFASSAYIEKGMYAEAVAEARKVRELNITSSQPTAFLCYALVRLGKQAEARDELEKLLKLSDERYVSPYTIALIYHGLNERDETFAWLERGFEQRDVRMTFLKVEPKWNNIRIEPRFVSLLKRMNLE